MSTSYRQEECEASTCASSLGPDSPDIIPMSVFMNSSGDGIGMGEASAVTTLGAVAGDVRGVVSVFPVSGTAMIPTAVGRETL